MTRYVILLNCSSPCTPKVVQYERDDRIIDWEQWNKLKSLCEQDIDLWEGVYLDDGFVMLVAEDGKLRNMPPNSLADRLYGSPYDAIVGDAVIIHVDEESPEDVRFLTLDECKKFIRDRFPRYVELIPVEDS